MRTHIQCVGMQVHTYVLMHVVYMKGVRCCMKCTYVYTIWCKIAAFFGDFQELVKWVVANHHTIVIIGAKFILGTCRYWHVSLAD